MEHESFPVIERTASHEGYNVEGRGIITLGTDQLANLLDELFVRTILYVQYGRLRT